MPRSGQSLRRPEREYCIAPTVGDDIPASAGIVPHTDFRAESPSEYIRPYMCFAHGTIVPAFVGA